MKTRKVLWTLVVFSAAAPALLLAALMHRAQTVVSIPAPGETVTLYTLSYKARLFEAKVESVRLEITSAEGADSVEGSWNFLGSNSDGQLHKVNIEARLLDAEGSQISQSNKMCVLGGGSHDVACAATFKLKAADWAKAKSLRVITDFQS